MIHPTALVDPRAEIDSSVEIGPYAIIEGPVVIGPRTKVFAHAVVVGETEIGADNEIHYGAIVGHVPQDRAFGNESSGLRIGDRNVVREHAQIHRGTKPGSVTRIGNGNYVMHNGHVGHNCVIGNDAVVAGGALLAGYVEVGDGAFVSGNCVVHQFVRIGRLAMMRGASRTGRDVPPFCIMDGLHTLKAVNVVGLRRAGWSRERIDAVRSVFRRLFGRARNLRLALAELEGENLGSEVREMLEFIAASRRGVCFGPRRGRGDEEDAGE